MDSNKLSAGANSFTPTGAAPAGVAHQRDSFAVMQEGIEQEMDQQDVGDLTEAMNNTAVEGIPVPASGLPAHMVRHAAEFWFPECRDCTCCKGFKHGCTCATSNNGVCTCAGKGAAPLAAAPRAPSYSGGGGGGKPVCKFFLSPRGCRFGDGCRFAHE
jgi:hypothetical protein